MITLLENTPGSPSIDQSGLLAQLLGSYQDVPAVSGAQQQPSESENHQPMEGIQGIQETIEQQMTSRARELEQLHAMGLSNDLQNIQVKIVL